MTDGLRQLLGLTSYDVNGAKIGPVVGLHPSEGGEIEWATVARGRAAGKHHLAPLVGARLGAHGVHLSVPKATIRKAPEIEAEGPLSVAQSERLIGHYGLARREAAPDSTAEVRPVARRRRGTAYARLGGRPRRSRPAGRPDRGRSRATEPSPAIVDRAPDPLPTPPPQSPATFDWRSAAGKLSAFVRRAAGRPPKI
ncbi:hypothetical protein Kfla_1165 [Kribbella flavida DSM 17836]|uniref:PRC-barrel domain-containing protein n=1 Tax=Kribbella flavida (strain DSM 17836 / JCM 10339 / NBRC 14399) TaxID=479435 RepID=D2Q2T8_KRIFD|nr:hypothetical protein [Kribbella flavida]ADB30269.1 hypothetical protein Kfla_1165 [Kribbella flavida DSM 17836]